MNKIPCLYCQTENDVETKSCKNCGMPMAKKHPQNKKDKALFFHKWFWPLVIFCIVMMAYLPR
jgi:predicted amidophosphoribosyltransferase